MDNDRTHGNESNVSGNAVDNRGVSHIESAEGKVIFKPLPWQREFLGKDSATEFHPIAAGKTEALIQAPLVRGYTSGPARNVIFIGATSYTVDRMIDVYRQFGAKYEGHRRRFVFPNGTKIVCLSAGQSLISLNGDLALVDDFRPSDDGWLDFVKRRFKNVLALGWGMEN